MASKLDPGGKGLTLRRFLVTGLAIVVLAGATIAGSAWITQHSRAATRDALTTVLETTQQAVHSWVDDHRAIVRLWGATPQVIQLTEDLMAVPATGPHLLEAPAQAELRAYLAPIISGVGYQGFFIISRDGVNLASTRDENVGVRSLLQAQPGFLQQVLEGGDGMSLPIPSDVPLPPAMGQPAERGVPTMFAGGPIRGSDGSVEAILVFRIDPSEDFTSIFQRGRIGTTGETYGFDPVGRLITESRFDAHLRRAGLVAPGQRGILRVEIRDPGVNLVGGETPALPRRAQPFTLMAQSAIDGISGSNVTGYRDYRGVPVVGAWLWDEEIGIGLTTEMDVSEASETLRRTLLMVSTLAVLAILLVALVSWDAAKRYELELRLEDAMAKVLSGYLPICASCKSIRQESGEWLSVEVHVTSKTEALFTHSICPDCSVSLYGESFED